MFRLFIQYTGTLGQLDSAYSSTWAGAQENQALLLSDTLMPITDKTYTTHCCHFLCIQPFRSQPSSQHHSGVWGNKDSLFSDGYELNAARWFWKECRAFPFLMRACVQCVDVLKQIAGDDRDTEHQFRAPSHYSQIQVTQKYTHTRTHSETHRDRIQAIFTNKLA